MSRSNHGTGSRPAPLMLNASRHREPLEELLQEQELEPPAPSSSSFEPPAQFRTPFVMHYPRRCRICRAYWIVDCLNGAEEPTRDPHWRCPDCRTPAPQAFPDRLPELVAELETPQLSLLAGGAPSEAAATIFGTDNEKSRHEDGSRKPFGEDDGSLARAADDLNQGGGPQHG